MPFKQKKRILRGSNKTKQPRLIKPKRGLLAFVFYATKQLAPDLSFNFWQDMVVSGELILFKRNSCRGLVFGTARPIFTDPISLGVKVTVSKLWCLYG